MFVLYQLLDLSKAKSIQKEPLAVQTVLAADKEIQNAHWFQKTYLYLFTELFQKDFLQSLEVREIFHETIL